MKTRWLGPCRKMGQDNAMQQVRENRAGWLALGAGFFVAVVCFLSLRWAGATIPAAGAGSTLVLMATLWIAQAIPLAATALIPVVSFPLLDVLTPREVAQAYLNPIVMLFIGGFLLAQAVERWELHKRFAFYILRLVGTGPRQLLLAFLATSFLLSMWISNTATALMMLTLALAVIKEREERTGQAAGQWGIALLLAIAYGCSLGGIATPIGTPTNLVLLSVLQGAGDYVPSFGNWLVWSLPFTLLMAGSGFAVLSFYAGNSSASSTPEGGQAPSLPPWTREEITALTVLSVTALLWIFRRELDFGLVSLRGWSSLHPALGQVDDGTVAVAAALLLFLLPASHRRPGRLLEKEALQDLPWPIVLLFGGGFALAAGFSQSGLGEWVGAQTAAPLESLGVWVVLPVSLLMLVLTEFTSNVATAAMMVPVLHASLAGTDLPALAVLMPATFAASLAFMMPVATPPNAIVFASGRVPLGTMIRLGVIMNLLGLVFVGLWSFIFVQFVPNP